MELYAFVIYLWEWVKYLFAMWVLFIISIIEYLIRRDYSKRLHIEIKVQNWRLSVKAWDHYNYTLHITEQLKTLKKKLDAAAYLLQAFTMSKQCNFIQMDCGHSKKFLMFWVGDGSFVFHWPLGYKNDLDAYTYAMLGVLNEMGISRAFDPTIKPGKKTGCYTYTEYGKYQEYIVNFGKDIEAVTGFSKVMFEQVFQQPLSKLRVTVG
jgi:hypothetical protein